MFICPENIQDVAWQYGGHFGKIAITVIKQMLHGSMLTLVIQRNFIEGLSRWFTSLALVNPINPELMETNSVSQDLTNGLQCKRGFRIASKIALAVDGA